MDKLLDLIPEFYYDLIARVIPGIVLIAISTPFEAWEDVPKQKDLPVHFAFAFLVCGYIVGFLLDAFSTAIEGFIEERLNNNNNDDDQNNGQESLFSLLDQLENNSTAKKPIKLLAELSLLRVLLTGWLIIGTSWCLRGSHYEFRGNVALYLIILIMLFTAYQKWHVCTKSRIRKICKKK